MSKYTQLAAQDLPEPIDPDTRRDTPIDVEVHTLVFVDLLLHASDPLPLEPTAALQTDRPPHLASDQR